MKVRPFNMSIYIFYASPSTIARIMIPSITRKMNTYCFAVSFSFRKILERISDTTHTDDMMGAAMAPFPLIAYTSGN